MNNILIGAIALTGFWVGAEIGHAQNRNKPVAFSDPAKVDRDFAFQGEYAGNLSVAGIPGRYGIQVIAMGQGKFKAFRFRGGLPGDGWDGSERYEIDAIGNRVDDNVDQFTGQPKLKVLFAGDKNGDAMISDNVFSVIDTRGQIAGQLKKVDRQSPTLGKRPPQNAVVLFDGSNVSGWEKGKMTDDGLLMQGNNQQAEV